MKALVTGGGGFLGRYIVERLRQRGDEVTVFCRGDYPELAELGCEIVRGDLRDAAAVGQAVAGMDVVFHVAALAGLWGKRDDFFSINVGGTENIIAGCREHGVKRLVYTSSPSVVFPMESLNGVDETQPYPSRFYAHYPESKAVAEQRVLAANDKTLATCSLRPHLIWGPRDNHIVPMLLMRARQGKLIQIGDGTNKVDITYVENAADAHVMAADALAPDSPVAGQAYFIGDPEPVNLWTWVGELMASMSMPRPEKTIGFRTAYVLGAVMEGLYTALPFLGEPRITRFVASQFAMSHYFDLSKARTDFGYEGAVSNEEGVRRTVAWFTEHPIAD